jgi:hypothetical protein
VQMPEWMRKALSNVAAVLTPLHSRITANITSLLRRSTGTKIAIVGPTRSGKTVIHIFLATGMLTTDYDPTLSNVKYESHDVTFEAGEATYKSNQISVNLADRIDVSGDYRNHSYEWQKVLKDAALVLFVFDMSKFLSGTSDGAAYRRTVVDSCDFAGGFIGHSDARVIMVGTHCDQIADWSAVGIGANAVGQTFWVDYRTDSGDAINNLSKNVDKRAQAVWGSLKDPNYATELLYQAFQPIA